MLDFWLFPTIDMDSSEGGTGNHLDSYPHISFFPRAYTGPFSIVKHLNGILEVCLVIEADGASAEPALRFHALS